MQNNEKDHDAKPNVNRQKQRKTAVALSVITCLFMCVIGYEIIRENGDKQEGSSRNNMGENQKPLVILEKPQIHTSVPNANHNYDSYQVQLLAEQNRLQAEKIKQLREELLSTTHRLHDLKPNLFKKENPLEQAKIADLTQQLVESEELRLQIDKRKGQLEYEAHDLRKKLGELELVRESLASMVESQRASYEQEKILNKKQLEDMRFTLVQEKNALMKKIRQAENDQTKMQNLLEDTTSLSDFLKEEVQRQNSLLAAKSKEISTLQKQTLSLYEQLLVLTDVSIISQQNMEHDLKDLYTQMEMEKSLAYRYLESQEDLSGLKNQYVEMEGVLKQEAADLFAALQWETIKTREMEALREEIGSLKQEMTVLASEYSQSKEKMSQKILNLIAAIEFEKLSAKELAADNAILKRIIEEDQDEHLILQTRLQELASEYKEHRRTAEETRKELEIFAEKQTQHIDDLQQELLVALSHYDAESLRTEELEKIIGAAVDRNLRLEKELLETLSAFQVESDKVLSLENMARLQEDRNLELQEKLLVALANHDYEELRSGVLESVIQMQVNHNKQLEQELLVALANQSEHEMEAGWLADIVERSKADIESEKQRSFDLESKLATALLHSEEADTQMDAITSALAQGKEEIRNQLFTAMSRHKEIEDTLRQALLASLADYEEEHNQALNLEVLLQETAEKAMVLEDEVDQYRNSLAAKQEEIQNLFSKHARSQQEFLSKLDLLSSQLEMEKAHAKSIENDLLDALHNFDIAQESTAKLEMHVNELAEQLNEKEKDILLAKEQASGYARNNQSLEQEKAWLQEDLLAAQRQHETEAMKTLLLEDLLARLQNDVQERQQALEQIEALKEQLAWHQASSSDKEKEIAALLEQAISEKRTLADHLTRYSNELSSKASQAETLQSDLRHMQDLYRTEQENLTNLEEIQQETSQKLAAAKRELGSYKTEIAKKDLEMQALWDTIAKTNQAYRQQEDKLLTQISAEKERSRILEGQLQKALASNLQSEESEMDLDDLMESLVQKIDEAADRDAQQTRIQRLEETIAELRNNQAPIGSGGNIKEAYELAVQRIGNLEAELQEYMQKKQEAEAAQAEASRRAAEINSKNESLAREVQRLISEKTVPDQRADAQVSMQERVSNQNYQRNLQAEYQQAARNDTGYKYKLHVVAQGDTLRGISKKYYGSASYWRTIYEANRNKISDESKLRPGTELKIPIN